MKSMITKGELKVVEQETRLCWLGLLALTARANGFRIVSHGQSVSVQPAKGLPTVLVLLANPDESASLCEAIRGADIPAGIAKSPQEASTLTADENVKLFVVDEAFVKRPSDCWQFRKSRVLPVAVIGSAPEREGWDRVVNLEADAYLSKSMSLAEQVARIKALLRRA
jgi:hypothetical protein